METIDKINYKGITYNVGFTIPNNAGSHNSFYRGEDITELFYDGTLSKQIAAGTFDNIFIGDYIIGKESGRKYLVADINYKLSCGNPEITTPHILMVPENIMGLAAMNSTNTTEGAYHDCEMRNTNLGPCKTIIKSDFGADHILTHYNYFSKTNTVKPYENGGAWVETDIDLMNERMVYGGDAFHNIEYPGGSSPFVNMYTQDKSQLALFRYRPDLIVARNDSGARAYWWLRDLASSVAFACVNNYGSTNYRSATSSYGIRPSFLVY